MTARAYIGTDFVIVQDGEWLAPESLLPALNSITLDDGMYYPNPDLARVQKAVKLLGGKVVDYTEDDFDTQVIY